VHFGNWGVCQPESGPLLPLWSDYVVQRSSRFARVHMHRCIEAFQTFQNCLRHTGHGPVWVTREPSLRLAEDVQAPS
jgi:hypothetical protein